MGARSGSRGAGAKLGTTLQSLAVEPQDRCATTVHWVAEAGAGRIFGYAVGCGTGYHGALGNILRGTSFASLAGPSGTGGLEGLAASERERGISGLPRRTGLRSAAVKRAGGGATG